MPSSAAAPPLPRRAAETWSTVVNRVCKILQGGTGQIAEPVSAIRSEIRQRLAGRDACDDHERCECDQDVDEAAQDDAAHPVFWLRLARSMDTGDPQGITAATPVDLEQAAGSLGAATTQLGEHELGAEPRVPDEPVSLGPLTSTSAQVAGVGGNGRDRIASTQTSARPSGSIGTGSETFSGYPRGRGHSLGNALSSLRRG